VSSKLCLVLISVVIVNACEKFTQEDRFNKIVYDEYHWSYEGIIVEKYLDEKDHNRHIIVLENTEGRDRRDFTFQSLGLFNFLEVGDSIVKERQSIDLSIKREKLDTVIQLDFGNIKGHLIYSRNNPYISK
jgi:hypothetical protein